MHQLFNSLYVVRNLITGHLANVQEGVYKEKDENLRDESQEVLRKAEAKLAEMMETLKRLHGLAQATKEVRQGSTPVSLKRMAYQTLTLIEKEYPLGEVEFLDRIPEEIPELYVNRIDLAEILCNLIVNALQAMKGKGKLILRACFTQLEGKEPSLTLKVIDTGPGIQREYLDSLFEPFFTTKPETEGNGLGLYIAKELTEKNGGKVTVESFPGHGTTFSLQFPILPSVAVS
jgi:signal transduction histidine kinase